MKVILSVLGLWGLEARANGKLDVMFGYYSLQATTTRSAATVSSLGSYQMAYRRAFGGNFEILIGYSLIAAKVVSGDLGFGPDIGLIYFPFTSSAPIVANSENVQFRFREFYKPYIGGSFHQRQFQSTQSTYAGFSGSGGLEYAMSDLVSIKAELRLIRLVGPSQATANELDILTGLAFSF